MANQEGISKQSMAFNLMKAEFAFKTAYMDAIMKRMEVEEDGDARRDAKHRGQPRLRVVR